MNYVLPNIAADSARVLPTPFSRPAVSVVLPVRDGGAFLPAALDSILAQSFRDFECLVVDDGSRDGSEDVAQAYADRDPRVRVLVNPGRGLVDALNHGILEARGEFIARMDADDVSAPDRLQRQIDHLRAHPQIAVLGTQVRHVDASGRKVLGQSFFPLSPDNIASALIVRGCVLSHPTVMAKRDVLMDVGLYRRALRDGEDIDLWLRVSERYEIANLPDELLDYRIHAGQVSREDNVRQKFSHALALLSARRRRSGQADPVAAMILPVDLADRSADAPARDAEVAQLADAVWMLDRVSKGEPLPASELRELMADLDKGLLHLGRKPLARLLLKIAGQARRRADWALVARAVARACRVAPSHVLRSALRPKARSSA